MNDDTLILGNLAFVLVVLTQFGHYVELVSKPGAPFWNAFLSFSCPIDANVSRRRRCETFLSFSPSFDLCALCCPLQFAPVALQILVFKF